MNKYITFSFDDGCIEDFKTVELLAKYGLKATFYVATNHNHNPLQPNEIKELSKIAEIGAHTQNHVRLDQLDYFAQRKEIETNKKYLEDLIGKKVTMFCPPKGYYNKETLKIVKELGFIGSRTTKDFQIRINDPFQMPTTLQIYPHKKKVILFHLIKNNPKHLLNFIFSPKQVKMENIFAYFNYIILMKGGIMHLWGHSWELEKQSLWQLLIFILEEANNSNYEKCFNSELIILNKVK